jgi:septal ring factor EnvC (AmiA/AmiB activator)
MRLPAIMVGLPTYGIFYLLLRGKVQQSQPNSVYELRAKLEAKECDNTDLRKKWEANLANSDLSSEQREQIIEDQRTIEKLNDRIASLQARYKAKRDALKKEERPLKAQVHDWDRRLKPYPFRGGDKIKL